MGTAKVVSLSVRPAEVSHLCFEVDGILEKLNTGLGGDVIPFDFPHFFNILRSRMTVPGEPHGDPSSLLYNSLAIQMFTKPATLASLRAERNKAMLDKAMMARQNAFLSKYANAEDVIRKMNDYYSSDVIGSKPQRLASLAVLSERQAQALSEAYAADSRTGVVKRTSSYLSSTADSKGASAQVTSENQETIGAVYILI
jgi:hypothetical protein